MKLSKIWLPLFGIVWLGLVLGLYLAWESDSFTPGESAVKAPVLHPQVELDTKRPTLLVVLHPECTCSFATLDEVERVAATCGDKLRVVALFESYTTLKNPVTNSELWQRAGGISGLIRVPGCQSGSWAETTGARTSGQAWLFNPDGRVIFSGGLTTSRGHSGASPGGDMIISGVSGIENPGRRTAPVFGCALLNSHLMIQSSR